MASKRLPVKQRNLLLQHRYILNKLASSSARKRKTILENAPSDLYKALNVIFKLIANDQLELSRKQDNKLGKHRQLIRTASGLTGERIKRKVSHQSGGSLASILATVLPVIASLLI